MSKIYLQLDYNDGKMYQSSNEEKEGFEPFTNSKGRQTYRKYFDKGVFGKLSHAEVRETDYGDRLQIVLQHKGDDAVMQFSLYDASGNVDNRYAESIIRLIPGLKKGEAYRFYPYKMTKEFLEASDVQAGRPKRDKYYDNQGVSVKTADLDSETALDKVEPVLMYSGEGDNVIPRVEWKMNRAKKNVPDPVQLAQKNEFLLGHLMDAIDGPLAFGAANSTPATATSSNESVPANLEEDDDLPF